jgi:hypothetical protein
MYFLEICVHLYRILLCKSQTASAPHIFSKAKLWMGNHLKKSVDCQQGFFRLFQNVLSTSGKILIPLNDDTGSQ